MKLSFEVSHELLEQLLHLPPTAHIHRVGDTDADCRWSTFYVEDTALRETEGWIKAAPSSTEHRIEWHWNVQ